MDVEETLRRLADGAGLPRQALQWALDHWDESAPRLLARFAAFAASGRAFDVGGSEAFYTAHLCGEREERGVYAPLCRLIACDRNIDDWLGDAVTETLPGILISVFGGDSDLLKRAIESPVGYEFARASALAALGYLVRSRRLVGDDGMSGYLSRLRLDMQPRRRSIVWLAWAETAANLGYANLRGDVERLIAIGFIPGEFDLDSFDRQVALAHNDAAGLAGFESDFVSPLKNAIAALERMSGVSDRAGEREAISKIVAPANLFLFTRAGRPSPAA
ncbi:MAG: DUF1186 domain-containing protein [Hyphomicrobiales bacterium]|nr:DUF1186 domain-containing protein [Hyphomicrobiales bacterium]